MTEKKKGRPFFCLSRLIYCEVYGGITSAAKQKIELYFQLFSACCCATFPIYGNLKRSPVSAPVYALYIIKIQKT